MRFRFRFQDGGRLRVERNPLQKRVMRQADFRRAQPPCRFGFRARRWAQISGNDSSPSSSVICRRIVVTVVLAGWLVSA